MAEGRRERIRKRIRQEGVDGLFPHELLEYMLYPYIPRKDTAGIARALLAEFGSLHGVFTAKESRLASVKGMTATAAEGIAHYLAATTRIRLSAEKKIDVSTTEKAGRFCNDLFGFRAVEYLYVLALDQRLKLIDYKCVSVGAPGETQFDMRQIANILLDCNASAAILAHNHPSGDLTPSKADLEATGRIGGILKELNIRLCDHLIVFEGKYRSLFRGGMLEIPWRGGATKLASLTVEYDAEGGGDDEEKSDEAPDFNGKSFV